MKDRNKAVPASYLVLKKDGNILLGCRINTGYYDGWYSVPAGHIEADELPLGGLIRETEEEIGIKILAENAKFAHVMYRAKHDDTGQRVDLFFVAEKWEGEIINKEPNKCDGLEWFPLNALPVNMIHYVRHALECIQKGITYSELPYNKTFINPNENKS